MSEITPEILATIRARHPSKLTWEARIRKAAIPNRFKRQKIAIERWVKLRNYTG